LKLLKHKIINCSNTAQAVDQLLRRVRGSLENVAEKAFSPSCCWDDCSLTFADPNELWMHLADVHNVTPEAPVDVAVRCYVCRWRGCGCGRDGVEEKFWNTFAQFRRHIIDRHVWDRRLRDNWDRVTEMLVNWGRQYQGHRHSEDAVTTALLHSLGERSYQRMRRICPLPLPSWSLLKNARRGYVLLTGLHMESVRQLQQALAMRIVKESKENKNFQEWWYWACRLMTVSFDEMDLAEETRRDENSGELHGNAPAKDGTQTTATHAFQIRLRSVILHGFEW